MNLLYIDAIKNKFQNKMPWYVYKDEIIVIFQ